MIIKQVPAHEVIAISFSGYTAETKIDSMIIKLKDWAAENKVKLSGEPTVSRYNPPWTPGFLRRNEISFIVNS